MSNFWDKIKGLFQKAEQSSPAQPVIHEVIERSTEFEIAYESWKSKLSKRRIIDWLKTEYTTYLIEEENLDKAIAFLNTPSAKGFVIHFNQTKYSEEEITFLFDYFKEKVKDLNYRTYLSDTRTYNRPNWVERVDKHYLKPSLKINKDNVNDFNQSYGNITIELVYRNDKIWYLKFQAVSYNDRLYKEADPFKELMLSILNE